MGDAPHLRVVDETAAAPEVSNQDDHEWHHYDRDAEDAVLGAVLLSDVALGPVINTGLEPSDFYQWSRGEVYSAMVRMYVDREPVDSLTLRDRLQRDGQLEKVGGRVVLDFLGGSVPAVGNVLQYAAIVMRKARWRRRRRALLELLEEGGALQREDEQRWRVGVAGLDAVEQHYSQGQL